MLQMHVGHSLSSTELERLQFSRVQDAGGFVGGQRCQPIAHFGIGGVGAPVGASVPGRYGEKLREESRRCRPPADWQKVDQLDEQPRFTVAGVTDDAYQIAQAGQETLVPYA